MAHATVNTQCLNVILTLTLTLIWHQCVAPYHSPQRWPISLTLMGPITLTLKRNLNPNPKFLQRPLLLIYIAASLWPNPNPNPNPNPLLLIYIAASLWSNSYNFLTLTLTLPTFSQP